MPGPRAPEPARREQLLAAAFAVATRQRLEGLTIRAVAREAGVSAGLVLFHFGSRDQLLVALLDWLLAATIVGEATAEILAAPTALGRLRALVARELELLPGRRPSLELFFDFWVTGIGHRAVRTRIQRALQRYRDAFEPLAAAVIAEAPARFPGVTGAELAGLVVAVIEGCVIQAVVDPRAFDVARALTAVTAVLAPAAPAAAGPPGRAGAGVRRGRRPPARRASRRHEG